MNFCTRSRFIERDIAGLYDGISVKIINSVGMTMHRITEKDAIGGSRLKLVQVLMLQNEASAGEGAQVGNKGSSAKAKLIGRLFEYRSKKHSV